MNYDGSFNLGNTDGGESRILCGAVLQPPTVPAFTYPDSDHTEVGNVLSEEIMQTTSIRVGDKVEVS